MFSHCFIEMVVVPVRGFAALSFGLCILSDRSLVGKQCMSSVHSRPWRKAAETLFQHVTCPYLMFFRLSNVSSMSASTPPCLESSTLGGLDTLRLRSLDASTHGSFATPRGFAALRLRRECAFTRMPVQCSLTHSLSSYKLPQKFFGDGAIHIPYPSHL